GFSGRGDGDVAMRNGGPGPESVDPNGLQLGSPPKAAAPVRPAERPPPERYRRLPTGAHGMARDEVARDQRERLQRAMTELIADRGYQAVRILDLTQLAHVSRPTFYELYPDKEELLLAAYNDIAARTATTTLAAFDRKGPMDEPRAERSFSSERARRAQVRLPSGRHDLPREVVESSQRERILDATAEIVAEKGLAALTIPEIASRANVSHETFYEMFKTKMDAFLSTQK